MILPVNLPSVGENVERICIRHINKGLLKGVDLCLSEYKAVDDEIVYFRQFFPRGFYGDYVKSLYRVRDVLASKMLYSLGDFDKYLVMCLLSNYCNHDTVKYKLKTADMISSGALDYSDYVNYHIISDKKDREKVVSQFAIYSSKSGVAIESLMASLEDLNQYVQTCFDGVEFFNLGDYSVEELTALHKYTSAGMEIHDTELHKPYTVL